MDAADWNSVLKEHGTALTLYAKQWCGSHADAEEAVQNAFLKVWKSPYRHSNGLVPQLYMCTRSCAIDLRRSRSRRADREACFGEESDDHVWFQSGIEEQERNRVIQKAIESLSPEQREVVIMRIWGELTFTEIGKALAISANTAASRYRYALSHLGKHLPEEMHDE